MGFKRPCGALPSVPLGLTAVVCFAGVFMRPWGARASLRFCVSRAGPRPPSHSGRGPRPFPSSPARVVTLAPCGLRSLRSLGRAVSPVVASRFFLFRCRSIKKAACSRGGLFFSSLRAVSRLPAARRVPRDRVRPSEPSGLSQARVPLSSSSLLAPAGAPRFARVPLRLRGVSSRASLAPSLLASATFAVGISDARRECWGRALCPLALG